jgi:glycosyltransferase involved in cell wall biosynthesis
MSVRAPRDDVLIVIPAYNEAGAIAETLGSLNGLSFRVVVVDDGSTDDTTRRAHEAGVTVLRHSCNLGQGAALQTGLTYALTQPETRFVVTFDADGQHDAADIGRMLEPLEQGECDVTLASRFAATGMAPGIPAGRRLVLKLAVALTRVMTGLSLTDTHNGLRAFTAEAARQIALSQNRMAHASEILSQIAARKLRYREIPAVVRYTAYSRAKAQTLSNGVNILWEILMERIR